VNIFVFLTLNRFDTNCLRYCTKAGIIKEEFLSVIQVRGQTEGLDYMEALKMFFKKLELELEKFCHCVTGSNVGFVSMLKKYRRNLTIVITIVLFAKRP
jgi:hypothetical protein